MVLQSPHRQILRHAKCLAASKKSMNTTEVSVLFWKRDTTIVKKNNQQFLLNNIFTWVKYGDSSFLYLNVKKIFPILKNKFLLTSLFFVLYILFIDDNDVFFISNQKSKLNELKVRHSKIKSQLNKTKTRLSKIDDLDYLEAYARKTKFFKKDDEEVFVVTYK